MTSEMTKEKKELYFAAVDFMYNADKFNEEVSAYIDGDNSAESEEAYSLVKRKEARVWDLYFKIWGVRIKPALLYGEIEEIIEEYAPYIN